ncbi:1-deoxy-D-xylulose-5-phosphate synthase N-terminal domain-containing protein [Spiroplasma endosymbiont of Panorpa germanica]|uniref:1-deoxy-D-xylulose-5-phosphate synthase N-terminal domain-containing protein n=1 Tax=Spiroplasma endosymbiont of Panorpa germanica TaxID=3066314 RepID=UPI0030D4EC03
MKLKDYRDWKDIYNKEVKELEDLINDLRFFLISHNNKFGGHLGSNLGVLEITVAILNKFSLQDSKIIFDTGHQSHFYKLLTNRISNFDSIRKYQGISAFQEIAENNLDHISNGHSSTGLSIGLAHKISNPEDEIIVVVGDAAFLNGVSLEGITNIANQNEKIIIIYNDNEHGIGDNNLKIKNPKSFFMSMGLDYVLCNEGNNLESVIASLEFAQKTKNSTVIHFKTKKSNGYLISNSRTLNHNISLNKSNRLIVSDKIIAKFYHDKISIDKDIKLISPGMIESNLLFDLKATFPNNVIDVGINEEHAVLLATGFAINKLKAVVSIYSTFFQRTFDQIIHDVARNDLPVTFIIEKVGLSCDNGVSHHGIYDLSMCNNINNKKIAHPRNSFELEKMLELSYDNKNEPFFIRVENKTNPHNFENKSFKIGEYEVVNFDSKNLNTLISYGQNCNIFEKIIEENNLPINLINARWLHCIDFNIVDKIKNTKIFIYEHVINNGSLSSLFRENNIEIKSFNLKSNHIGHGKLESLLKENNIWYNDIIDKILN